MEDFDLLLWYSLHCNALCFVPERM